MAGHLRLETFQCNIYYQIQIQVSVNIFLLLKYIAYYTIKQKYYNMIMHYFDNRFLKQANKCVYQSTSKILHILMLGQHKT